MELSMYQIEKFVEDMREEDIEAIVEIRMDGDGMYQAQIVAKDCGVLLDRKGERYLRSEEHHMVEDALRELNVLCW